MEGFHKGLLETCGVDSQGDMDIGLAEGCPPPFVHDSHSLCQFGTQFDVDVAEFRAH